MQFKLTNFFENWSEFFASVPNKTINDSGETLQNVFDSEGNYLSSIEDCADSLLFYFRKSKSFRSLFTGYSEEEAEGIVEYAGSAATKAKLASKIVEAFEAFAKSQGKTIRDYSYDIKNSFGPEQETPVQQRISTAAEAAAAFLQSGETLLSKVWLALPEGDQIKDMISAEAEYSASEESLGDGDIISGIASDKTRAQIRVMMENVRNGKAPRWVEPKPTSGPLGASFAKAATVDEIKQLIGDKVLFVASDKAIAYDELNDIGRNKSNQRGGVVAFRISAKGLLSYQEFASYSPRSFTLIPYSFTEITGESHSYGPRRDVSDERLLAFIRFNAKKGKKFTMADDVFPAAIYGKLETLKKNQRALVESAKEILRPTDATSSYKDNYKVIPQSMVFYNHDYPYDEIRFLLGDKLICWNKESYGSRPVVEELSGREASNWLTRSFLSASNSFSSNGYNQSWSVYRASASQKKQVYERLVEATKMFREFVKIGQAWYDNLK